jgi:hypothetical protein
MTAPWSSTVMKDLWISVATHGTASGLEVGHRRAGQSSEVVERMEAMNDDQAELEEFGKRWAEAELARDLTLLDAAVVVGVPDQEAAYRGRPNNGQFRATKILVRDDSIWRLVGMHVSPIATPPGPPQQQG